MRKNNGRPHDAKAHKANTGKIRSRVAITAAAKKLYKPVSQYTKDNILVKTFSSIKEAQNNTKIPHSNISECCRDKRRSAGGYVWRYLDKKENLLVPISQ